VRLVECIAAILVDKSAICIPSTRINVKSFAVQKIKYAICEIE
jgi:hypothetical protein